MVLGVFQSVRRHLFIRLKLTDKWSQRYFKKFEKYIDHPEYPDVDKLLKGADGPMHVGYFSSVSEGSKDFIKACTKIGIPYNTDFTTTDGTRGVNRVSVLLL